MPAHSLQACLQTTTNILEEKAHPEDPEQVTQPHPSEASWSPQPVLESDLSLVQGRKWTALLATSPQPCTPGLLAGTCLGAAYQQLWVRGEYLFKGTKQKTTHSGKLKQMGC